MDILRQIEAEQAAKIEAKRTLPEFNPGDTVRVLVRVTEGTRTRVQAYEGVCIGRAGSGFQENFTVRKISYGVGVERIFPDNSPNIDKVEVIQRGRVHQARLYYLRDLSGKAARIKEREGTGEAASAAAAAAPAEGAAEGGEGGPGSRLGGLR